jgi:hypothetical protein
LDGLAAYSIKWEFFTDAVRARVGAWVSKKVAEALGAEEPDFAAFMMDLLARRAAPADVLAEAGEVLDEDAPPFVTKLYRVVVYETEGAALAAGAPAGPPAR